MRRTIDFILYDWLKIQTLCSERRFSEHSRDTFDLALDTCERIAAEQFAPHSRSVDVEEPALQDGKVILPRCAHEAASAYRESGMLASAQDYELGGMQLPAVVQMAGHAFFAKAGISLGGAYLLTLANANLLMKHGTREQGEVFARKQYSGQWSGTMCLSESQAGSSLADITTRAIPDPSAAGDGMTPLGKRYRLFGNKMWISNGDHDLTENIVHLVLAKIPSADGRLPQGSRGISLFVVPKMLVDNGGALTGERNDVVVAGLNHKLGWRGIPNTLLNFGEGGFVTESLPGAIGFLVGEAGTGLRCMFDMMNEARIAIGLAATAIGYAGYEASVEYARTRVQGRPLASKARDPGSSPVPIIEHPDVKRMLLAQKSYVEASLALQLYCTRLVDELRSAEGAARERTLALLELLTPIAKSWPSEWCLEANSLAIQVHGGCGYTRDFPVEQLWRDNRLNMIHEGTHGIQALDLLGRKVRSPGGLAFRTLEEIALSTAREARAHRDLSHYAADLAQAFKSLSESVAAAWTNDDPEQALSNATPFMQAFGHAVIAWLWLDMAITAARKLDTQPATSESDFLHGKQQAAKYFFEYELPKIAAWLNVVSTCNPVCRDMKEEWFPG